MLRPDDSWMDRGACRRHPVLDPLAWDCVESAHPTEMGAMALLVCQFACPVRAECKTYFMQVGSREQIAGGGWFSDKGRFYEPAPDLLDTHQAAAYTGIPPERMRRLISKKRLVSAGKRRGRAVFHLEEVQRLGRLYGPRHGTPRALRQHLLRGETICRLCQSATDDGWVMKEMVA